MSFLRELHSEDVDLAKFGIDQDMLELLFNLGIFGAVRSYFPVSQDIFTALLKARPNSQGATFGMGILLMCQASYDAAIELFENNLLKAYPDDDIARAYLAMSYNGAGDTSKAQDMLEKIAAESKDSNAVALANAYLDGKFRNQ